MDNVEARISGVQQELRDAREVDNRVVRLQAVRVKALEDGYSLGEAELAVHEANQRCVPPLPDEVVDREILKRKLIPVRALDRNYAWTDAGNSERLADYAEHRLVWNHAFGWMEWGGKAWAKASEERIATSYVVPLARGMALASPGGAVSEWARKCESASKVAATIKGARGMLEVQSFEAFDGAHWQLNCPNGVVNLRTGALEPHDARGMHTRISGVSYDPLAKAPRWESFLSEVMGGDLEMVRYLQRVAGQMLTGDTSSQEFYFAHGPGGAGKGVFVRTLLDALGDYGDMAPKSLLVERRGGGEEHPTILAGLKGRRGVFVSEVNQSDRFDAGRLKMLTGEDKISARVMRGDFFSYMGTHTLFLMGNHKPKVDASDTGVWRRMRLLPFVVQFGGKADPALKDKLRAELPGVLAWMVRGCLDWQETSMEAPAKVMEASEAYREEQDALKEWVEDCVELHPLPAFEALRVKPVDLWKSYLRWCEENELENLGSKTFYADIKERFPGRYSRTNGDRFYRGLGVLKRP